jgi:L-lactate dehydrogenase complex protein LldG
LRKPAPHRHPAVTEHVEPSTDGKLSEADQFRAWLPPVGPSIEERIALFAQNCAGLKTDFRDATSIDDAVKQLAAIAVDQKWLQVASHRQGLAPTLADKLGLPCLYTDSGYSKETLEQCDASITSCEALVAQTGSVLVTAPGAGGRALSVLPPHHVVIAQRSQLVPDIASALQVVRKKYAPDWPSFMSFITGPSRTGDIERILVLGAHGPKKMTVFLVP